MFIVSFTYADHLEPFLDRLQLLNQVPEIQGSFTTTTTTDIQPPLSRGSHTEPFTNYIKCAKHPPRGILKDIFQTYEIYRARGSDWDVFLPCTYTGVEEELRQWNHHRGKARAATRATTTNTNLPTQDSLLPDDVGSAPGRQRAVFAIEGCDTLVSKNKLWSAIVSSYGRKRACAIMPPTYILTQPGDEKRFLEEYVPGATYICKKNIQQKKGLMLTDNVDTIMRSHTAGYKVVQQYMTEVHTIKQHKLNLRLYVLIVCGPSGSPKQVFVHEEGKCTYTAKPYNPATWEDEASQITSVAITTEHYDGVKQLPLTFGQLRAHWQRQGISYEHVMARVHDKLRLAVGAVMSHLCTTTTFENHVQFQLFGADVILSEREGEELEPLVLEFNKGPSMTPINQTDYVVKRQVLEDVFKRLDLIPHASPYGPGAPRFVELHVGSTGSAGRDSAGTDSAPHHM
jgi:hypothetical protein